ncbi:hypothetical protein DPMN_036115 [Dreissena polymorpha]|uniref:Uncharacterized protein n=1 Tax=Dreissena polymorpha TaxID=45954 RepID=A0A9D4MCC9_DREPO|nr:hypothetical protein DPMN_036115 [Dreissena polymorpha]
MVTQLPQIVIPTVIIEMSLEMMTSLIPLQTVMLTLILLHLLEMTIVDCGT